MSGELEKSVKKLEAEIAALREDARILMVSIPPKMGNFTPEESAKLRIVAEIEDLIKEREKTVNEYRAMLRGTDAVIAAEKAKERIH